MFERFTDKARLVVVGAQAEARELRHSRIGPEHLLLGLISENKGVGVMVLRTLDIDPAAVAGDVKELIGQGEADPARQHIPFTAEAKETLKLALREAQRLRHDYIGTEHLLLGLMAEADGVPARVLAARGLDLDKARAQVTKLLTGPRDG